MAPAHPPSSVSDQVSRILENCGVSLFQVSQESARRYRDPLYHVPHRLYSNLRNPEFTPSIHQILALSSITRYRIMDWLSVFGFPLASISRMQAILPSRRTRLIDTAVYDGLNS